MTNIKNTFSFLYHWHQRIGLFMCIGVISWALSGLAHPVIARLNPTPAAPPPAEALNAKNIADFSTLIEQHELTHATQVRLFQWQGQAVYRIADAQGVQYFSAETLAALPLNDFEYARTLADYFLGDISAEVTDIQLINTFDKEYLYINRYLPVVRVDYARADQPQVYVDPVQGRLATINNRQKIFAGKFFRTLHSWTWISNIILRKILMTVFLVTGFFTALFGLLVYIKSWRMGIFRNSLQNYHPASRRWHRTLGACASVFVMTFTASGLLHLHLTDRAENAQPQWHPTLSLKGLVLNAPMLADVLGETEAEDIQLVQIDKERFWRIKTRQNNTQHQHHEHHHGVSMEQPDTEAVIYLDATSGRQLAQGWQGHARYLARALSELPAEKILRIDLQQTFDSEYGFVNKRLPVHAVHFDLPGEPTLYIETATSTLASEITRSARIEGYSFGYLHKWHLIDFLGNNLRDFFTSLVALLIILVLLLGCYRFFVRKK